MAFLDNMKDISELSEKKGEEEPGFSKDSLETYEKLFEEGDFFENLKEENTDDRMNGISGSEEIPESDKISETEEISESDKIPETEEISESDKIPETEEIPESEETFRTNIRGCPIEGNGGKWEGERGNSIWIPNRDDVPKNPLTNPNGLTWEELLDKYEISGILFRDGEADFSEVLKGEVEIEDFTDDRAANFDQADEKLAEQNGCTPEEVAQWREEHKYTWHECKDCRTMQKVPTEIHGNISHSGGVSEYRMRKMEE